MADQQTAIRVSGLSKLYRIQHRDSKPTTAVEAMVARMRHPLRRQTSETFAALQDLDFEIKWGDAVGILGRNGAGKSTLLKVLTRITAPSAGRIELGGRVGSLLEVGTGFHPELTGRENVYLNGTLLGMRRSEIRRRFDEIVAFSGVERFLDTPVKRYSSGMYVRLAFAVAAHLETEILAIDEVLAVGDAEFQAKCIEKMRSVARDGRTVLYVSHQVHTVTALCTSAMYLQNGRLVRHGTVDEILDDYRASFEQLAVEQSDPSKRFGTGEVRFRSAELSAVTVDPSEDKILDFAISRNPDYPGSCFVSAHINDHNGSVVAQCDSRLVNFWIDPSEETAGSLTLRTPWLKPGRYSIDLFLCSNGVLDAWEHAATFQVTDNLPYVGAGGDEAIDKGLVLPDFDYKGR